MIGFPSFVACESEIAPRISRLVECYEEETAGCSVRRSWAAVFRSVRYQVRATIAAFPGALDRGVANWRFIPGYSHGEPTAEFVGPEAYSAGVREHDVVTSVNGQSFNDHDEFFDLPFQGGG